MKTILKKTFENIGFLVLVLAVIFCLQIAVDRFWIEATGSDKTVNLIWPATADVSALMLYLAWSFVKSVVRAIVAILKLIDETALENL